MAIAFAATEIDAFEKSGGGATAEQANYASGFSRSSVALHTPNGGAQGWVRARFASLSTMWATWRHYCDNAFTTNYVLYEAGGPEGAIARVIVASSTTAKVQRWDGAGWVDVGSAFTVSGSDWTAQNQQSLAVKIDGSSGFIRFWHAGVLKAEFVGNTATRAGMTGCTYLWFGASVSQYYQLTYISEVIIGDTDNRLYRLVTLAPTGNGANTAWTNDVTAVNAFNSPDTSFISSGTAGEKESFALGNLPAATADTGEVKAVSVVARHNIQAGSGPQNINGLVRTGGADHTKALGSQSRDVFGPGLAIWDTNPATGQKWTRAEVDALEAGVQSAA